MILGLTGKNASGKGEVANYLKSLSFSYFSLSDEIREELKLKNIEENRENLIRIGNEIRTNEGPGALAKRLSKKIPNNSIIDSIRNPSEVEELRKLNNFHLIAVDTPIEIRYKRACKRGRNESSSTLEEFKAIEEKENSNNPNAQQLNNTIALADFTISNKGTILDLHKKVELLLKEKLNKQ